MEMIEYIKQYHQSERSMTLVAAGIGLAFLLIAWATFRQFGIEQYNRGLIYTLVVGGLLLLSALGFAFGNDKKISEVGAYKQTNAELQQIEIQRIEKILATGYHISTVLASILIVGGLALVVLNPSPLLRGVGMGIFLFGAAMVAIYFFSINKHRIYLDTLKGLKF